MCPSEEPKNRLDALRELLDGGELSTQDELREKLEKLRYSVTQSTISRDLRKLGAIKAIDTNGRTVYRLRPESDQAVISTSLQDLVYDIQSNGAIIVVHTSPGSASLVAKHFDHLKPGGILGTIAGEDTIFIAPPSMAKINETVRALEQSLT